MRRALFYLFLLLLLTALVLGAVAFWTYEPTLHSRSRFLKPSSLITAGSVPSTGPGIHLEPTVQETAPAEIAALAERYQPTLVVSARDRFWPVSVLNLLRFRWGRQRTCLFTNGHCRYEPPAVEQLRSNGSPSDYLQYPAAVNNVRHQFVSAARAAGVSDAAIGQWRRTPTSIDPFRSAQIYFYYLRHPPPDAYRGRGRGVVGLEYWFFYPLNYLPTVKTPTLTLVDPLGATIGNTDYHQGDFEHIAVLLDERTHRPRYLWMARHGNEGLSFPWGSRKVQRSGDHPIVYAAFGSHAVYRGCGIQRRTRTFYTVNDYVVCIPRQTWGFDYRYTPMVDLAYASWACWPGHLGQSGKHLNRGTVNFVPYETDGPVSPLRQQENVGSAC